MRINIIGAPGSGKSTVTADMFSRLKRDGYNIELMHEYVKNWVYINQQPKSFDQMYLFAKQLRQEDLALRACEHIITDCPLLMCAAYGWIEGVPFWEELLHINDYFEHAYDNHQSINIFLNRQTEYIADGRFQKLEEESNIIGTKLLEFMDTSGIEYVQFNNTSSYKIYEYIEYGLNVNSPDTEIS